MRWRGLFWLAVISVAGCGEGDDDVSGGDGDADADADADADGDADGDGDGDGDGSWSDPWELWSDGVRLRGASIYQRRHVDVWDDEAFGVVGPPYDASELEQLRALGANVVGLSHPGPFTETEPYGPDEAVYAELEGFLDDLLAADLFAIVSFRTGPGRNEFAIIGAQDGLEADQSVWSSAVAQDGWVAMWRDAATRLRDHPAIVAYDLMVEPNANELFDQWEPSEFYAAHEGDLSDWNPLAQRIAQAIREVDDRTPIIVGGMSYSALPWLEWVDAGDVSRLVLSFHQYAPYEYTHQDGALACADARYPGEPCTFDEFRTYLGPAAELVRAGHPVVANEFGAMRWIPGATEFLSAEIDAFEEIGVPHAMWDWGARYFAAFGMTEFDPEYGTDPDVTDPVPLADNPLLQVFADSWANNDAWPSTATTR